VISRQDAGPNSPTLARDESEFNTDNRMLVNGLLSLGYEFGEHTVRLTNLFIRDTVKQSSLNSFKDLQEFPDFDFLEQNTAWYERQLIDSQAVAEFEFGPLSLDLRGGFARTDREAPFNLTYTYGRTANPPANAPWRGEYLVDLSRGIGGGFQETGVEVVFSNLYEELWYGGIDLGYELTPDLSATIGYAYTDTDRYSERRGFEFDANIDPDFYVTDPATQGPGFPPNGLNSLQQILEIVGRRSPWLLLNSATYNMFDVNVIDQNAADPAFEAELTIHAGYAQAQWLPTETLTIQGGVRYEDADQSTTPVGALNKATPVAKTDDYWLPGVTLTWQPIDDLQLRASGSRTIARPQFRELVRQRYFDPETNRQYSGNPFLTDSELLNFEARAEYYLGGGSNFSLAGFYKEIEDPIEVYVGLVTGDRFISYANAPKATLYGAEADLSYVYDLFDVGGWFETKQIMLQGNYTYTKSELSVVESDSVVVTQGENVITAPALTYFRDGAPLVGQSDHLVNLQVGLEDADTLQQFTVLFSYASERVSLRGSNNLPDVIEEPGMRVDIVVRQGLDLFGTEAELKLEARNLFGRGHEEYQVNSTGLRIENNTYDVGQSFGASLSVTF
jgi:TonB-dependent receptor